jgi:hypothetical protein
VTGSPPTLVVRSAGTALRRRLGPTAWVVLEAAVALARDADGAIADHSQRALQRHFRARASRRFARRLGGVSASRPIGHAYPVL